MRKIRALLPKLTLSLIGFLICLCGLEVAARIYARLTHRERVTQIDSLVGWKLRPRVTAFNRGEQHPYMVETNSRGLRDVEHPVEKRPGVIRVLALGDSFVFGSGGVAQSDRFTDRLQAFSKNLEVINSGIPGYSTDQEYLYLKSEGLGYRPDVVMLCLFSNDYDESFVSFNGSISRPKGYFSSEGLELKFHPPALSTLEVLGQYSYVFGLAEVWLGKLRPQGHVNHPVPGLSGQDKERTFRLILTAMAESSKRQGAEMIAVYLPFANQRVKREMQLIVQSWGSANGVPYLDLTDFLGQAGARRPAHLEMDIHFNSYGHQLVARALYDFLLANTSARAVLKPLSEPGLPGISAQGNAAHRD